MERKGSLDRSLIRGHASALVPGNLESLTGGHGGWKMDLPS